LFVAVSPGNIPRLEEVSLDGSSLAFTFGMALLTGVTFGLAPAWRGSRADFNQAMKETSRGISTGLSSRWTRQALVVAETAIAIVLLIGTGLMLRSFARLLAADRGFRVDHVVTADLDFSVSGFTTWVEATPTRPQVALQALLERVRHLPGVQDAGAAYHFLRPDNQPPAQTFVIYGRPILASDQRPSTEVNAVTPGYLKALGVPLLRGRDVTEADTLQAPGVALVSESFASRFFTNKDPLGQHVSMVESPGPLGSRDQFGVPIWCEIVGVVGDVKSLGVPPESVPEVYRSYWQYPMQTPTLAIRASGSPSALVRAIRREARAVVPGIPEPSIQPMAERVSASIAQPRFEAEVLSLFGLLALFLAACGIYGVLAFSVSQRTQELGVRAALGADKTEIITLVLRRGLGLALGGIAIGVFAALALTRLLRNLLYEVGPTDTSTFAGVAFTVLAVAALACWLPARRAAAIDPAQALRHE
jgi:predicted permease